MTMDNSELNQIMSEDIPTVKSMAHILPHPWRRYFARGVDLSLYNMIWTAFCYFALNWDLIALSMNSIANLYIPCGLMLILEPIMLSTWGTTPGKWLFGLQLRDINREKITFSQGFNRTFGVFRKGMGFNIPIYNLYTHIKSYQDCDDVNALPWDEGFDYRLKDTKLIRIIGFLVFSIAIYAVTYIIYIKTRVVLFGL